ARRKHELRRLVDELDEDARDRRRCDECANDALRVVVTSISHGDKQRLARFRTGLGICQATSELVGNSGEPRLFHGRPQLHLPGSGQVRTTISAMAVAQDLRSQLLHVIPDERRVTDVESALDQHAADLSYHEPRRPDVVVYPESTAEVAAVLEL